MSQQRGTETDQLASVIEVIQLGRKTGILIAQRGEGLTRQEGKISFMKGHIVHASCSGQTGPAALTSLNAWGSCRFLFQAEGSERATGPLPTPPRTQPAQEQPHLTNATTDTHRAMPSPRKDAVETGPLSPQVAPKRLHLSEQALSALEQQGLSRQHRRLLLLIDGQRTPNELARLIGRATSEVYTLLHDLAALGLVYQ